MSKKSTPVVAIISVVALAAAAGVSIFFYKKIYRKSRPITTPDLHNDEKLVVTDAIEVEKIIEPKLCKLLVGKNKVTGFIADDSAGLIYTSFHLLNFLAKAYIKPQVVNFQDGQIMRILKVNGYIDDKFYLTKKASTLSSSQALNLEISKTEFFGLQDENHHATLRVTPEDSKEFNADSQLKKIIFESFLSRLDDRLIQLTQRSIEIFYQNTILLGKVFFPKEIKDRASQLRMLKNYMHLDILPIQITYFEDGLAFEDGRRFFDTGTTISILPGNELKPPLQTGEDVYFAGFPLTQERHSFSKGMISLKEDNEAKPYIILDGPVVPGCSGGPVLIKRRDQIHVIGIISSELAHVSEQILEMNDYLQDAKQQNSLSLIGNTVHELLDLQLRNLSTGKGRAITPSRTQLFGEIEFYPDPRTALDLLVPGQAERQKKPIALYIYINKKPLHHIGKKELLTYINNCIIEKHFREQIYRQIGTVSQEEKYPYIQINPIELPLTEDKKPSTLNIVGGNRVSRAALLQLYACAYLYGGGGENLKNQLGTLQDDYVPHSQKLYITSAFLIKHGPKAKYRRINESTVMSQSILTQISQEIIKFQAFYVVVYREILNISGVLKGGPPLMGLYFLTKSAYQLYTKTKTASIDAGKNYFFYSVVKKENKFYLHHFEDIADAKGDCKNANKYRWQFIPTALLQGLDSKQTDVLTTAYRVG